jgi:hypothetical protein
MAALTAVLTDSSEATVATDSEAVVPDLPDPFPYEPPTAVEEPFLSALNQTGSDQSDPATMDAVRKEVADLREEVVRLTQSLEIYHETFVAELEHENALLREELSRVYNRARYAAPEESVNIAGVPRPGGELFQDLADHRPEDVMAITPEMPRLQLTAPEGDLDYTVVEEWGRSPEQAAQFGDNVASLKGLVAVIPPGGDDTQLADLGQRLRQDFASYDNLDLRIFDDGEAAQRHIEDSTARQPILKVTRHRSTNKDLILRIRDGQAFEVWSSG